MLIVSSRDDLMGGKKASLQGSTFGVYLAKLIRMIFLCGCGW